MVAKIIAYEQQSPSNSAVFAADRSDGFDFANVNAAARQTLPPTMTAVELIRDGTNDAAALRSSGGDRLRSAFCQLLGHGSTGIWRGNIFTRFDAEALTNTGRLPVFLTLTCLNGFSHHVSTDSISEALLKNPNGGAVAVWASSGTTLAGFLRNVDTRDTYFAPRRTETWRSPSACKGLVFNGEVRQTWMLFGDPSMKLR
ncbi:MAG: hypothetical protein IPG67_05990 [Acidobacteria bacterium]|nr:hypothetical protein [Acidobacteriota bacterium]